jgi:hypothetical protein
VPFRILSAIQALTTLGRRPLSISKVIAMDKRRADDSFDEGAARRRSPEFGSTCAESTRKPLHLHKAPAQIAPTA